MTASSWLLLLKAIVAQDARAASSAYTHKR